MLSEYLPRLVDRELQERLGRAGATVIEGPKACGKTRTARQAAASEIRCDAVPGISTLIDDAPHYILDGPTPRLVDEWQTVPTIWNHIRHAVDDRADVGQFILTGSAVPADDTSRHSGAGRFSRIRMRTLTFAESGVSDRRVSLQALMEGQTCDPSAGTLSFGDVLEASCMGGWPGNIGRSLATSLRNNIDYLEETTRLDISRMDNTQKGRDPHRIRAVIRSLARSLGSSIGPSTIQSDLASDRVTISPDTVSAYLDALHRVFFLESIYCWPTHLRSKAILRTKPKVYLVDPSIAVAALRANPDVLIKDLPLLGQIFENLVVRDLLVYAQHLDYNVYFYRDSNGLEVDAIIESHDGRWMCVEIKLGSDAVDAAAATLNKFVSTVDTSKKGEPTARVIITGTGVTLTRSDGIHVVNITSLAP